MANILITGGTGLIGNHLIPRLLDANHSIKLLSRNAGSKKIGNHLIETYQWNIKNQEIDAAAFKDVDIIIHLAGKNINTRWTKKAKRNIIESRTASSKLLLDYLQANAHSVKKIISASAIGYYGETATKAVLEHEKPGNDFLSITCQKWEASVKAFESIDIEVTTLRIGVVLSNKGGAYKAMKTAFSFGLGSAVASGNQFMSWVHIKDVGSAFIEAVENTDMKGTFNLTAPGACTNQFFSQSLAQSLHLPFFLPNVPEVFLKLFLGERANLLLTSTRTSCDKILNIGFPFEFDNLKQALIDLRNK